MGSFFQVVIGIAMLGAALYTSMENIDYARKGLVVTGKVVAVTNRVQIKQDSWSFKNSPVVEFVPRSSTEMRRFRSSIWTSALFAPKTGDRVSVAYLEDEPENARVDTWLHWCFPLIFAMLGVAMIMGKTTGSSRGWGFRWTRED